MSNSNIPANSQSEESETYGILDHSKVTLAIGVYAGMYICQNFQVPRVNEPAEIMERIKELLDNHKKK